MVFAGSQCGIAGSARRNRVSQRRTGASQAEFQYGIGGSERRNRYLQARFGERALAREGLVQNNMLLLFMFIYEVFNSFCVPVLLTRSAVFEHCFLVRVAFVQRWSHKWYAKAIEHIVNEHKKAQKINLRKYKI